MTKKNLEVWIAQAYGVACGTRQAMSKSSWSRKSEKNGLSEDEQGKRCAASRRVLERARDYAKTGKQEGLKGAQRSKRTDMKAQANGGASKTKGANNETVGG